MEFSKFVLDRVNTIYGKDPIDDLDKVRDSIKDYVDNKTVVNSDAFLKGYEQYLKDNYSPDPRKEKVVDNVKQMLKEYDQNTQSNSAFVMAYALTDYFLNTIVDMKYSKLSQLLRLEFSEIESGEIGEYISQAAIVTKACEPNELLAYKFPGDVEKFKEVATIHEIDITQMIRDTWSYETVMQLTMSLMKYIKQEAETMSECVLEVGDAEKIRQSNLKIVNTAITTSNKIATDSRRGAGNFIVVSPMLLTIMSMDTTGIVNLIPTPSTEGVLVPKIGTINSHINVFRDAFAVEDYILIGYTGEDTLDAGFQAAIYEEDSTVKVKVCTQIDNTSAYYKYIPVKINGVDQLKQ